MNKEEIISKLRKKLHKSGWESSLYHYWSSSAFEKVVDELMEYTRQGKVFIPSLGEAFRFLEKCPYDKVKCVIFIDYTNNFLNGNDGIPLSCSKQGYASATLLKVLETAGIEDNYLIDLSYWTKQGVLMIPVSITTELDKKGHKELWKPFHAMLIDKLNQEKGNIPYILINKIPHGYRDMIRSKYQLELELQPYKKFDCKGMWEFVNSILKSQGKETIRW